MSYQLPSRLELRKKILASPDEIRRVLRDDPALAEYVFSDTELKRKYVRLPDPWENQLAERSKQLGVAEGVLIGLGIALLIAILAEAYKNGRI